MGVHNVASKGEWENILAEEGVIVVDAFATWCGPCKIIAPRMVELSEKYPGAKFYKLDVDELPDVAKELGITAMPTILAFKNGEKINSVRGANPPLIEQLVAKALE